VPTKGLIDGIFQNRPYAYSVSETEITNHAKFAKIGYNGTVNGATAEIIAPQGGSYVFPTAEQHMHIKSSSVEDDISTAAVAPGTGIHTLTIYYLNSKYEEKSETVTLNGQASVETTATDIFRINNVRAATCGTTYAAVGNISILNHGETITYGYVAATHTRQRQLVYTVPVGMSLYLTNINRNATPTVSNKNCTITVKATYDDKANKATTAGLLFFPISECTIGDGVSNIDTHVPRRLPEKTDIIGIALSSGTHVVEVMLTGWLEYD
jgi:hypothetical protein